MAFIRSQSVILTEPTRLALASAGKDTLLYQSAFALDTLLARSVFAAREPVLVQIRLAWWRDRCENPMDCVTTDDPLLGLLLQSWGRELTALVPLIDGWESLLGQPKNPDGFIDGRTALASAIAAKLAVCAGAPSAETHARLWALADLANWKEDPDLRPWALDQYRARHSSPSVGNRSLRPFAVLGGLASRALARGGTAMLGDRLSPLVALRLGLFGR